MSQQKQSAQAQNTSHQALTLPAFSNGNDLTMQASATGPLRPWWRRRAGIIGIAVVLLIVLAGGLLYTQLNRQAPPAYQYAPVIQGDLALNIDATGPLQSPATYNLVAATTGIIAKIDVKVGQKVTQGQVLAELDKTALQDAVNQAQATVNADQDTLYNTEVSTGWVVTPAVNQAQDTLKIAQAQLAAAQHGLDSATLRAPHAGVVTAINGTVGGTPGTPVDASSGTSGSNYFIQIVDLSALQVVANVNESDIANLKLGDPVHFTVDAYGDRQFAGTVESISSNGVTNSNVVAYPVVINVDIQSAQGTHLLPGMTAAITISVLQHHNVLIIPVSAISLARSVGGNNGTSGASPLISQQDVNAALSKARHMLAGLQNQNPAIAAESPTPAFVIERSGRTYIAKPVVLGITDGTSYEVLDGLSLNETFIAGVGGSNAGSSLPPSNGGSGNSSKGS